MVTQNYDTEEEFDFLWSQLAVAVDGIFDSYRRRDEFSLDLLATLPPPSPVLTALIAASSIDPTAAASIASAAAASIASTAQWRPSSSSSCCRCSSYLRRNHMPNSPMSTTSSSIVTRTGPPLSVSSATPPGLQPLPIAPPGMSMASPTVAVSQPLFPVVPNSSTSLQSSPFSVHTPLMSLPLSSPSEMKSTDGPPFSFLHSLEDKENLHNNFEQLLADKQILLLDTFYYFITNDSYFVSGSLKPPSFRLRILSHVRTADIFEVQIQIRLLKIISMQIRGRIFFNPGSMDQNGATIMDIPLSHKWSLHSVGNGQHCPNISICLL